MATATSTPSIFVEDQVFTIANIGWDQYVVINDVLSERRGLRMIYLDGSLTLVSPSRRHDYFADLFDAIIKAVASGCGILWDVAGSATFRAEELEVEVEADKTYYFGDHALIMGGPVDIDLTTQPPPDLAVEVEYTDPANDSMLIYHRLGVLEVWRYHVKKGTLVFLHRRPEGGYEVGPRSKHLPMLAPEDVLDRIRRADEVKPLSAWVGHLPAWVRDVIPPRVGEGH